METAHYHVVFKRYVNRLNNHLDKQWKIHTCVRTQKGGSEVGEGLLLAAQHAPNANF